MINLFCFFWLLDKERADEQDNRIGDLANEIKMLKIALSAGAGSGGGGGMDIDALGQLMKMINELGDELRTDTAKKYV